MSSPGMVPLEYFEYVISGFLAMLGALWLGITWRVYVNNERRIMALENYADPRNEDIRNRLLMSQFENALARLELRLGNNLEAKRASIEQSITQVGTEVVQAVKNGGAK